MGLSSSEVVACLVADCRVRVRYPRIAGAVSPGKTMSRGRRIVGLGTATPVLRRVAIDQNPGRTIRGPPLKARNMNGLEV